jgi:hypothetical protein
MFSRHNSIETLGASAKSGDSVKGDPGSCVSGEVHSQEPGSIADRHGWMSRSRALSWAALVPRIHATVICAVEIGRIIKFDVKEPSAGLRKRDYSLMFLCSVVLVGAVAVVFGPHPNMHLATTEKCVL